MVNENIDLREMYKIESTYRCTNRITKSSIRMQCVKFEVARRISFGYYVTCDTHSQTHPLINKRTEALLAVRKPWTFCNACEMIHRSLWQNQLHHGVEAKTMTDKNANTEIRKEFCPNCEAETPCTHEAELYVCDICGEDFAKYIVSRNCNVSDVSMTQDVLTDVKTRQSVEIEKLQIRLSEWRGVARQLADELKEEISSKCTVIWEEVGETSPAWIAYNNLVDTEDYETNPDYYNPDYQSPWISITSGRLPEKFQECIVLDKRRHVHNWIHDDALLPLFAQYTHWMPLPEPPESEGE